VMAFETNEPLMDEAFPEDLSKKEMSTFEDFKQALDELGLERIPGLAFDFEKETFTIKLETQNLDSEKVAAFQDLAAFINQNAKKQKRASFKRAQDDNPKYAFRTWLIRLGMNGPEYKTTRKVLLQNLEGSAAFRKVSEPNG
ncbi:virulence-related protein, partial [Butyricicoccus sp. 1XD8-22]